MAMVWIALGSNLGERAANLETAINLMGDDVCVLAKSSLYQTKPWGYLAQDDFYNQVLVGETSLRPQKLLSRLKGIEKQMGRKKTIRNGPRVIDLDILLYDDLLLHSKRLTIPHPPHSIQPVPPQVRHPASVPWQMWQRKSISALGSVNGK